MANIGKLHFSEQADKASTGPRRGRLLMTLTLGAKLLLPSLTLGNTACADDTTGPDDEAGVTTNISGTSTDNDTDNDSSTEGSEGMESDSEGSEGMESDSEGSEGAESETTEGSTGTDSQGEVGDTTEGGLN